MKTKITLTLTGLLVSFLTPVALLVPSVGAATVNWNGFNEGGDPATSSIGNWFDAVPVNGDSAVFGVTGNYQSVDNDLTSLSLAKIIFSGNNTFESSKSYTITGNPLTITSGIDAIMTGSGGDHKVDVHVTLGADATFKTTGVDTLQVGDTGTMLTLGSNDLTLQPDGGTITLAGGIDGSGTLILTGDGSVNMLAIAAPGYTGAVEVSGGVFATTAETEGNIIINGGTLKGNSDLLGTITMTDGAIAPGNSPGCLGTGDLTFTGGSYDVEINGTEQCTEYDSMTVVGAVDLGSATQLSVSRLSSFEPEVNDVFAIIVNDGTDAIEGNFDGLENGDEFTVDGYTYQINYDAGVDGNDVVLLVKTTPTTPDTGIGTLLTSPLTAAFSALAALSVVGGLKFAEQRRR